MTVFSFIYGNFPLISFLLLTPIYMVRLTQAFSPTTTYLEGKLRHYGPREPACSSEGFGYACIIMPDLTLFSCTITDWDISFSAHLPPVLPEASGLCLERCQYSYDQFSGITNRPSVRMICSYVSVQITNKQQSFCEAN